MKVPLLSHPNYIKEGFQIFGRYLLHVFIVLQLTGAGFVNEAGGAYSDDLAELSLEDLLNIKVVSVTKKEQDLYDTAAAVYVMSNVELERSGATSVAEALRQVPGVNVGAVNSSQRAISSRGLNHLYANKLQVMVDGRSVYNPLFSGVYWDLQMPMLQDLERIEVIRGPGATIWGANAVNGVINVVSRSARDTQGGLIYAGAGDIQRAMTGVRHGGQVGENTWYRVFAGYYSKDDYELSDGTPAGDSWEGWNTGFRLDHYPDGSSQMTLQAEATVNDLDGGASEAYNINTIGRWSRELSAGSAVEIQFYYDRTYRDEISRSENTVDTYDFSAHHTFGLGERHDIIWGVGYRFSETELTKANLGGTILNGEQNQQLFSAFVQDAFEIVPDQLTLTAGIKLEHNDFTGVEIQPGIRIAYEVSDRQTLWASVSRAVRTPNLVESRNIVSLTLGPPFLGPDGEMYIPTMFGNAEPKAEILWAFEAGYRTQPADWINFDLAVFYNNYSRMITLSGVRQLIPGEPFGIAEIVMDNVLSGETYGGEILVTMMATESWRITASWSLLKVHVRSREPGAIDEISTGSPVHQLALSSSHDITSNLFLDLQVRYVDSIRSIPAYVTADLRIAYRVSDSLEISIVGQNLLDKRHAEQASTQAAVVAEVPRGFYGKLTWRF